MTEFTRDDIVAHRFITNRRKGYDPLEVDEYLTRLADHVGRMEAELVRHQASERAALDVLQQAQRVADETVAAAQRDAETLRQNAKHGLENAKKDARATLDAARAEADRALLSARVQAEAAVEHSKAQISELEASGVARTKEFDRIVEELRVAAAQSATELRSAGVRLVEMAEHFEFKLATGGEEIGMADDVSINSGENRVEVT